MRRYITHLKDNHTTHERRQYAMRAAGGVTLALFAVWLGTLGLRFGEQTDVAQSPDTSTSLTAAAAASTQNKGAQLEVSTTSVFQ